jgi:hypothetical protein
VPPRRWKKIVKRTVEDAENSDPKARRWLAEYLLSREPGALTKLAATELAGTLDEEIQVQAARLRGSVMRQSLLNRVTRSALPVVPDSGTNRRAPNRDGSGPPLAS